MNPAIDLRKFYLDSAARYRASAERWRELAAQLDGHGDANLAAFATAQANQCAGWADEDEAMAGQFGRDVHGGAQSELPAGQRETSQAANGKDAWAKAGWPVDTLGAQPENRSCP